MKLTLLCEDHQAPPHVGYGSSCPVCAGPATGRCRCRLNDTNCANGHSWFECPTHGLMVGEANHGERSSECVCTPAAKSAHNPGPPIRRRQISKSGAGQYY
jgi:hypothetical protein